MSGKATYAKSDVQTHGDYGHNRNPAVNVKVYDSLADGFRAFQAYEPDSHPNLFTLEWIERHVSDETQSDLFWLACQDGFERLQELAEALFGRTIYGKEVKVYSEGRMGGWAVVHGLPDIEDWNAADLGRWRRFEKLAKDEAKDVMYRVVSSIYANQFEAWKAA